ncbi:hypothetical protein FGB62_18g012 [Gracilaria domingensis]|nr:hypothetical protein FGB62_18g012 [Gracilaria domingensis]
MKRILATAHLTLLSVNAIHAMPEVETRKRKKSGVKPRREEQNRDENPERAHKRKRIKVLDASENDIREYYGNSMSSTSSSISGSSGELRRASMRTDSLSSSTSRERSHGSLVDDEKQRVEGIAASKKPVLPRTP